MIQKQRGFEPQRTRRSQRNRNSRTRISLGSLSGAFPSCPSWFYLSSLRRCFGCARLGRVQRQLSKFSFSRETNLRFRRIAYGFARLLDYSAVQPGTSYAAMYRNPKSGPLPNAYYPSGWLEYYPNWQRFSPPVDPAYLVYSGKIDRTIGGRSRTTVSRTMTGIGTTESLGVIMRTVTLTRNSRSTGRSRW